MQYTAYRTEDINLIHNHYNGTCCCQLNNIVDSQRFNQALQLNVYCNLYDQCIVGA